MHTRLHIGPKKEYENQKSWENHACTCPRASEKCLGKRVKWLKPPAEKDARRRRVWYPYHIICLKNRFYILLRKILGIRIKIRWQPCFSLLVSSFWGTLTTKKIKILKKTAHRFIWMIISQVWASLLWNWGILLFIRRFVSHFSNE